MNESEEIFCLNYELNTLAGILLRHEAERWVPGFIHNVTEIEHVDRYKLACLYAENKKVLDIACGSGRGTYMLATEGKAEMVEGFDIQLDALRYASWRNKVSNNSFGYADAENFSITDSYDLAVSYETIEHIPDYIKFLNNVFKSLVNDGIFLVSTPIASIPINDKPSNPYHIREWGFLEFQRIISEYFDIEKIYVQVFGDSAPPPVPVPQVVVRLSLVQRILRKLKHLIGIIKPSKNELAESKVEIEPDLQAEVVAQVESPKYPQIEEYTGQYNISELGTSKIGYQIILARKK